MANNSHIDLEYGLKYESRAREKKVDKYNYKIIKISEAYEPRYDFKAVNHETHKKIRYEVKTTRQQYNTIFIEYHYNNKPSGINLTTAHFYAFVDIFDDDEQYYVIRTSILKKIIETNTIKIVPNRYKNAWGFIIDKNIIVASSVVL
jgi:hypothetical protein